MNLPDDALAALWALYDASGIRPEYVLPVLYYESSFRPDALNAPTEASGLGQDLGVYLRRKGIDPTDYRTWSAAEQIDRVIAPRLTTLAKHYGIPRSATRVYQSNFMPATLATAPALWSPVAWAGSQEYASNPHVDRIGKGSITVSDFAALVASVKNAPELKNAIARAYQVRKTDGPAREPIYGADFPGFGLLDLGALATLVAGASALRRT